LFGPTLAFAVTADGKVAFDAGLTFLSGDGTDALTVHGRNGSLLR
jgi:hypothetical protein